MKFMRKMLAAKIHRATVTQSNVDYEGSIAMSPVLREAAGLMPYEAVQIWNVTSGARFETYAIPYSEDSGEICINGAASHLAKPGDLIIVARFIWLEEHECKDFQPKIVFVNAQNKIKSIKAAETKLKQTSKALS
jgi:aspartate 1-decarboxylase